MVPFDCGLRQYERLQSNLITFALLAANIVIHIRPHFLHPFIPSMKDVWFNAHLIFKYKNLKRFFLSPFYHGDRSHLASNMISLFFQSILLETSVGSIKFASMVGTLLVMSQGITLLLVKFLLYFNYEDSYYANSVGFSGVLFAMRVVLNSQSGSHIYLCRLLVPARYAAWLELVLIQMVTPDVSFTGHLAGLLAGILYVHLKGTNSERTRASIHTWRCRACTFDNLGPLSICEMCETHRHDMVLPSHQFSRHFDSTLEELRRLKLERFG